jgi:hypothetical protein
MPADIFIGRRLVIATQHEKEKVIAPHLQAMGAQIFVPADFDTDQFGTFSGEIERKVDPLEAARRKCIAACEKYGCSIAIASEGSFGAHPGIFFVPADDEILVLMDLKYGLEIKAREISTQTNFSGANCSSWQEVKAFAKKALFPSHGLIVRIKQAEAADMVKGIINWQDLRMAVTMRLKKHGQVFVETDMRAMYNPTRMSVIEQAAIKLADSFNRLCPECRTPGFDIANIVEGLPCSHCGIPTRSTLSWLYECQKCKYHEERKFPNGKQQEDPMYCNWCNP